ncbi:MAG: hypothetical protein KGI08_09310 [Thaumarchaeota archaeon]|nr:hypothetical protein [Nitrososphaerota archaeon]
MTLQLQPCKKCKYQDYNPPLQGNTVASWRLTNWISKEPIVAIKCDNCKKDMQIFYQAGHRRFYKCWNCNFVDVDKTFYDNGELYPELDRIGQE